VCHCFVRSSAAANAVSLSSGTPARIIRASGELPLTGAGVRGQFVDGAGAILAGPYFRRRPTSSRKYGFLFSVTGQQRKRRGTRTWCKPATFQWQDSGRRCRASEIVANTTNSSFVLCRFPCPLHRPCRPNTAVSASRIRSLVRYTWVDCPNSTRPAGVALIAKIPPLCRRRR